MSIVITISRQLGSRGSYIATAVAKRLNLRYIDREILNRAAEIAGYPDEAMVAQLENKERVPGFLDRFLIAMNSLPMIPTIASATLREGYTYDEKVATLMLQESIGRDEALLRRQVEHERRVEASESYTELMRQVIQEYAQVGNVIIVGRGGQVLLHDHANVLHIRVMAPKPLRIQRLVERLGLDAKEAEKQINQSDKERARYLKHFYDVAWEDPDLYHMVVNTGKISVDLSTHLISEAAQRLGHTMAL
ncbi:MAG TPA: cytidylate kinase-like family protein [Anaerolineae bacterium]|nr:cytidylate kinase-like family protein [Anaerolineae bacterium]